MPGELAHSLVEPCLDGIPCEAEVRGRLWIRDGLPLLSAQEHGLVFGYLLRFRPETRASAYETIGALEPRKHYEWAVLRLESPKQDALALVGLDLPKGAEEAEGGQWRSSGDPLFTAGIEVVDQVVAKDGSQRPLVDKKRNIDWHRVFRLEAAYLLLWSAIERFSSLRYGPWRDAMQRIKRLGEDPLFAEALLQVDPEIREVLDSRSPREKKKLLAEKPKKAAEYYYQVRSNLTHRGKAAYGDAETVRKSLVELLEIFRKMLAATHRQTGDKHHEP